MLSGKWLRFLKRSKEYVDIDGFKHTADKLVLRMPQVQILTLMPL